LGKTGGNRKYKPQPVASEKTALLNSILFLSLFNKAGKNYQKLNIFKHLETFSLYMAQKMRSL